MHALRVSGSAPQDGVEELTGRTAARDFAVIDELFSEEEEEEEEVGQARPRVRVTGSHKPRPEPSEWLQCADVTRVAYERVW